MSCPLNQICNTTHYRYDSRARPYRLCVLDSVRVAYSLAGQGLWAPIPLSLRAARFVAAKKSE